MSKVFIKYLLEGNNQPIEGKIVFDSSDHIRFQNGQDVSGHNYNSHRRLIIEKNIQGGEGYTITMYNLDGVHPLWQNNIQMAPKRMKIVNVDGNIVDCVDMVTIKMHWQWVHRWKLHRLRIMELCL
ncbi:hypothetical protein ACIXUI_13170 [Bacteroides fragilis]|nr:hypothetical protein [Bacteroides ovatus]